MSTVPELAELPAAQRTSRVAKWRVKWPHQFFTSIKSKSCLFCNKQETFLSEESVLLLPVASELFNSKLSGLLLV